MEEKLVRNEYDESEEGIKYMLSYFILSEKCDYEREKIEKWGVKIAIEKINSPSGEIRSVSVRDITSNEVRIHEIINMLAKNKVTPLSLRDIIDDYI